MSNAFREFSKISKQRAMRWHRGGLDEWSITDWTNALAGEVGELCNAVKKLRRLQDQLEAHDGDTPQPKTLVDAMKAIRKEVGDVYTYLDLVAQRFGFDMFETVRDVFNGISVREGFPERIPNEIGESNTTIQMIREAAEVINTDRDFRVHSNRVTEQAIQDILRLSAPV